MREGSVLVSKFCISSCPSKSMAFFNIQTLLSKASAQRGGFLAQRNWRWPEYTIGAVGLTFMAFLLFHINSRPKTENPVDINLDPKGPLFVSLTLVEGAVDKGAVCLDGSPPGYHLDRGSGSGKNNWVVHLEGGGWCSTEAACLERAGTRLGSSGKMENRILFGGILNNSPLKNPDFYNWNRVKVRYCDGGSLNGEKEETMLVNSDESNQTQRIYYRGQRIWQAVIDDLLSKGMDKAERALLSGCSAGGLASMLHCDDFHRLLPKSTIAKCLADAGFFLDMPDLNGRNRVRSFYKSVVNLHGIDANLDPTCKLDKSLEQCFFPRNLLKLIKTPLFIIQPAYDIWQIENIIVPTKIDPSGKWNLCKKNPVECSEDELHILQGFREKLLNATVEAEISEVDGLYINSCFIHCQTELDLTWHGPQAPTVHQKTIADAVGDWFFERKRSKLIDCAYPCNPSCYHVGVWGPNRRR